MQLLDIGVFEEAGLLVLVGGAGVNVGAGVKVGWLTRYGFAAVHWCGRCAHSASSTLRVLLTSRALVVYVAFKTARLKRISRRNFDSSRLTWLASNSWCSRSTSISSTLSIKSITDSLSPYKMCPSYSITASVWVLGSK